MCEITRRGFMVGCSAAIAGLAGSRFNTLAFAQPTADQEVLVVLFLRGGIDGLSMMPPIAGTDRGHYEAARPEPRHSCFRTRCCAAARRTIRPAPDSRTAAGALPERQPGVDPRGRARRSQPQPFRRHGVHGARDSRYQEHTHRMADEAPPVGSRHSCRGHHAFAGHGWESAGIAAW